MTPSCKHPACRIPVLVPWHHKIPTEIGWLYPERSLARDGIILLHDAAASNPGHSFSKTELDELGKTAKRFERIIAALNWAKVSLLSVFPYTVSFSIFDSDSYVHPLMGLEAAHQIAKEFLTPFLRSEEALVLAGDEHPFLNFARCPSMAGISHGQAYAKAQPKAQPQAKELPLQQ